MTIKEFEIQSALGTLTFEMKRKLADNKRTSKKILAILSTDEDWHIKSWVAKNPNTPVEVLTILSKDKAWGIRYCVANNPSTPKEIAAILYDYQRS